MDPKQLLAKIDQIAQKATIDSSALSAGTLSEDKADQFISTVIDQSKFLQMITIQRMNAPSRPVSTLGIASRIMRTKADAATVGVTISDHMLNSKTVIVPVSIDFDFLEDLSVANGEQELLRLFSLAITNDIVDMLFNGNEATTGDAFLKINNGLIKLLTTEGRGAHIVDTIPAAGALTVPQTLTAMVKRMPAKWRNKENVKFIVNPDLAEDYIDTFESTSHGLYLPTSKLTARGIEVVPQPYMPTGYSMLTDPKNIVVGIQRDIRIGRQINERNTCIDYTFTMRFDFETAIDDAIVLAYNSANE